jgi:iron complex transport system ATP-binding protein
MGESIILEAHHLTVGYKSKASEVQLFENLDLTLQPRQLICLMGPNGAGKSTLIRTLAGLQEPLAGKINFSREGISSPVYSSSVSQHIAVVLTDRIAASHLTVLELVTLGRYPYLDWTIKLSENDKQIINQSIKEVNIEELVNKKIYALSDGQLQMAMIARALTQDTPIILLDEPTAHLDLNNRVEIMKLLKRLTRNGKSILISTHDLDLALQTADEVWLAGKGQGIISGIPEDLVLKDFFDDIFQFKGFDLKTGKVIHAPFRNISVKIKGQGHSFLWTKNALERNGYNVDMKSDIEIIVEENPVQWRLLIGDKKDQTSTLSELLDLLQSIS